MDPRTAEYPQPRWLVLFTDAGPAPPGAPWTDRLLAWGLARLTPGMSHCLAATPLGQGFLVVDPRSTGIDVHAAPAGFVQWAGARGFAAVWAQGVRGGPARFTGPGLFTCVAVVEALIGIRTGAVTPYRLYTYLKAKETRPMGGFFSSPKPPAPPPPDTSALDKAQEERDKLQRENDARRRAQRARGAGTGMLRFDPTATPAAGTGGAGGADKLGG